MTLLIFLAIVFIVTTFIAPAVRVLRRYWMAHPAAFATVDLAGLRPPAKDCAADSAAVLASLGFRSIGTCTYSSWANTSVCCSVWVRDNTIAEITFTLSAGGRPTSFAIAVGQEFSDGSSLAVINTAGSSSGEEENLIHLPGISDIVTLDEVAQALISKRKGARTPWLPEDAIGYKSREQEAYAKSLVNAKQFRLVRRDDESRLSPTWRFAVASAWAGWKQRWLKKPNPFGNTLHAHRVLKELGFGNLQSLRRRRISAFPVVVEEKSSVP